MKDFFTNYNKRYERMGNAVPNYEAIRAKPERYKVQEAWLPEKLDAKILDIGCGWGILLLSLWATGRQNLTGVDISESMCEVAKKRLPDEITIICADALEFLDKKKNEYDLITIFDVAEHLTVDNFSILLKKCNKSLTANGSIVIRTPNMANILAVYSRYIDVTHLIGYTEWSLFQLLDNAGFKEHRVIKPLNNWKKLRTLIRLSRGLLNTVFHEALFMLRGQNPRPSTYSLNITVQSWKKKP